MVDELGSRIRDIAPDAELVGLTSNEAIPGGGAGIKIWVWGRWLSRPPRYLTALPDLRWMHVTGAGVDKIVTPELRASDVTLTNAAGVHAIPIAESVMGMMIAIVKRLPDHWRNQTLSQWERYRKDELHGKTIVIVGTGRIGAEIARRARVFGMHTIGVTSVPRATADFDQLMRYENLPEAVALGDFVVMAAAMTAERKGLMGAREVAAMKPTAWFINIARGSLVDEGALLEALQAQRIGGAYLDVFVQEPLPADHPFWTLPNVYIIPHNTAYTWQVRDRSLEIFYDNLRRWVKGEPLVNVVDKERGY